MNEASVAHLSRLGLFLWGWAMAAVGAHLLFGLSPVQNIGLNCIGCGIYGLIRGRK